MPETKPCQFFLGANTPLGFYSLFDQLEDPTQPWHSFLIKGGPGCGKSSFLRRAAAELGPSDSHMELIPCSSDPDSLDAVLLPQRHLSLMDATAPHAREADLPGLRHSILAFGDYLQPKKLLPKAKEIEELHALSPRLYGLALSYLRAAAAFLENSRAIASWAVDEEKVLGYAKRFAAKHFRPQEGPGVEQRRFLSAICCKGLVTLEETPAQLCRKLYLIEDDCGAVAPLLLEALRRHALAAGHRVIVCPCPMDPQGKAEHLLIPSAGVGFLSANHFHPMEEAAAKAAACRRIHARRFQDQEWLREKRGRFAHNRRAATQLLEQAVELLQQLKEVHDRLESAYSAAMDFPRLNAALPQILQRVEEAAYPPEEA